MNYASNDEIFQEILDIEKLGDGTLTAEQKYRIAYMVIHAYHQGVSTGFIESTNSLTTTNRNGIGERDDQHPHSPCLKG
jgi:hypothetical protein